ncbi:hypothetical protein BDZ89DRAFT_1060047, partial [Hymenopellis radicata]
MVLLPFRITVLRINCYRFASWYCYLCASRVFCAGTQQLCAKWYDAVPSGPSLFGHRTAHIPGRFHTRCAAALLRVWVSRLTALTGVSLLHVIAVSAYHFISSIQQCPKELL